MLRAYSIGHGASTKVILGIGWIIIVETEAMGTVREGMMVFAWGLNLLVAEVLIRRSPHSFIALWGHSAVWDYGQI